MKARCRGDDHRMGGVCEDTLDDGAVRQLNVDPVNGPLLRDTLKAGDQLLGGQRGQNKRSQQGQKNRQS